jgi:arsenite methyltransferase
MAERIQDQWAQWLLQRRHGGDPQVQQAMLEELAHVRATVLEHAQVAAGATLLDVGAGDGLIAFGALPLVDEQGTVILSDISQGLLDHCHGLAERMGVLDRCRFLRASADDLSGLENASVDVVTTRAVLIYVPAKQRACAEFFRILKPGGRLSICEPINRFAYPEPPHLFLGYDVTPVRDLAAKVKAVYERLQPPDTDPMLDFDERDLLKFVENAGFADIHLELRADITRAQPERWETFLRQSGNPKIPTHEEALHEALSPAEARQFTAHLRPLVERGQGTRRMALAYLWAVKHAT